MAKEKKVNLPPPNDGFALLCRTGDPEFDGGIIGKPGGYSSATGRERPDMRGVGEEMLRGEHPRGTRARDSIRNDD